MDTPRSRFDQALAVLQSRPDLVVVSVRAPLLDLEGEDDIIQRAEIFLAPAEGDFNIASLNDILVDLFPEEVGAIIDGTFLDEGVDMRAGRVRIVEKIATKSVQSTTVSDDSIFIEDIRYLAGFDPESKSLGTSIAVELFRETIVRVYPEQRIARLAAGARKDYLVSMPFKDIYRYDDSLKGRWKRRLYKIFHLLGFGGK